MDFLEVPELEYLEDIKVFNGLFGYGSNPTEEHWSNLKY
jgi:hypothetical protein